VRAAGWGRLADAAAGPPAGGCRPRLRARLWPARTFPAPASNHARGQAV